MEHEDFDMIGSDLNDTVVRFSFSILFLFYFDSYSSILDYFQPTINPNSFLFSCFVPCNRLSGVGRHDETVERDGK